MKAKLKEWAKAGYHFNLDWLLRSVNTVLTGEAKFQLPPRQERRRVQDGLKRATKHIDTSLNLIGGRLGLDHDQVLLRPLRGAGHGALPRPAHGARWTRRSATSCCSGFVQAGMWGRFSGSTESFIDQDLAALEGAGWRPGQAAGTAAALARRPACRAGPLHRLEPRRAVLSGALPADPHGRSARLGHGLPLKASLLGKMSRLEVHHIFPKAQLYKRKYRRPEVNALANFCFLTKDTNLDISDRLPEEYFPKFEARIPARWPRSGFRWIRRCGRSRTSATSLRPARRCSRGAEPAHGGSAARRYALACRPGGALPPPESTSAGGITSEDEEAELEALNDWVEHKACRVACWPSTLPIRYRRTEGGVRSGVARRFQEELSQPVAVLLNEANETVAIASQAGFRCFTDVGSFKAYVLSEVLAMEATA